MYVGPPGIEEVVVEFQQKSNLNRCSPPYNEVVLWGAHGGAWIRILDSEFTQIFLSSLVFSLVLHSYHCSFFFSPHNNYFWLLFTHLSFLLESQKNYYYYTTINNDIIIFYCISIMCQEWMARGFTCIISFSHNYHKVSILILILQMRCIRGRDCE